MRAENIRTILLVEDEISISEVEIGQLSLEGYKVVHALSGEEAIKKVCVEKMPIDLILMDIDLGGGMNGTEAAQIILGKYNIPILFLSSHKEKDLVELTERITCYGYVVKNSSITVLDASIKMAFKLFEAKTKLQNQMDEFNDLYNNAPCGYHTLSPEGIFLKVNDKELEWLGYDRRQLVGIKNFIEIIYHGSIKKFQDEMITFDKNGKFNNLEIFLVKKDGSLLPVLLTGCKEYDLQGNYISYRATITDNTEILNSDFLLKKTHHELEVHKIELEMQNEELRKFHDSKELKNFKNITFYELSPVAYFTLHTDGTIMELNKSAALLLGKGRDILVGSNFKFFVIEKDRNLITSFLEKNCPDSEITICYLSIQPENTSEQAIQLKAISRVTNEKCYIAVLNMTELKIAQDRLGTLV